MTGPSPRLLTLAGATALLVGALALPGAGAAKGIGANDVTVGSGAVWVVDGDGSLQRLDPADGRTIWRAPGVADFPVAVAATRGSVWIGDLGEGRPGDGALVRVDADTGRVRSRQALPAVGGVCALAAGASAVWAAGCGGDAVVRVDPRTGRPTDVVRMVGGDVRALAAGPRSVWVALARHRPPAPGAGSQQSRAAVRRIDGRSRVVAGPAVPVDRSPVGVAAGPTGIWVVGARGEIVAIDRRTARRAARAPIEIRRRATGIVASAGSVWVTTGYSRRDELMTRIDAGSGAVIARVAGDGDGALASAIAAGPEAVWLATAPGGVTRVDARTGRATNVHALPHSPELASWLGRSTIWRWR